MRPDLPRDRSPRLQQAQAHVQALPRILAPARTRAIALGTCAPARPRPRAASSTCPWRHAHGLAHLARSVCPTPPCLPAGRALLQGPPSPAVTQSVEFPTDGSLYSSLNATEDELSTFINGLAGTVFLLGQPQYPKAKNLTQAVNVM